MAVVIETACLEFFLFLEEQLLTVLITLSTLERYLACQAIIQSDLQEIVSKTIS